MRCAPPASWWASTPGIRRWRGGHGGLGRLDRAARAAPDGTDGAELLLRGRIASSAVVVEAERTGRRDGLLLAAAQTVEGTTELAHAVDLVDRQSPLPVRFAAQPIGEVSRPGGAVDRIVLRSAAPELIGFRSVDTRGVSAYNRR